MRMPSSGIQVSKPGLNLLPHIDLLHHIIPRSRSRQLVDQPASLALRADGSGLGLHSPKVLSSRGFSRTLFNKLPPQDGLFLFHERFNPCDFGRRTTQEPRAVEANRRTPRPKQGALHSQEMSNQWPGRKMEPGFSPSRVSDHANNNKPRRINPEPRMVTALCMEERKLPHTFTHVFARLLCRMASQSLTSWWPSSAVAKRGSVFLPLAMCSYTAR